MHGRQMGGEKSQSGDVARNTARMHNAVVERDRWELSCSLEPGLQQAGDV